MLGSTVEKGFALPALAFPSLERHEGLVSAWLMVCNVQLNWRRVDESSLLISEKSARCVRSNCVLIYVCELCGSERG